MLQLPLDDSGVMSEKFFLLQYLHSDMSKQQKGFSSRKYISAKICDTFKEITTVFLDVFWLFTIFVEYIFVTRRG